ncbi:GNAT family N-acetyltransferase [Sphingobium sufflavum]|uniref:GNAT family N-acetyltransferase n=1 Tax=Sphingobium sufflavum TaxID=1129547 RepID=UPI001F3B9373|nr:GNAT family N-acetyltransferase [Sphingobium sufflavum]MCE7795046.1 GNAT family N-acetyltransferase [Sphingobium sufflavum]
MQKMGQDGWRAMTGADVATVAQISDTVHGRYTERADVYAERLHLYPAGCFLFERDGVAAGYLIAHPWRRDGSIALNATLGAIPADADCLYLHDLALLSSARGTGAGRRATERVVEHAREAGFDEIRLVAVNGAESFWKAQSFVAASGDAGDSYGSEAVYMRRRVEN